MKKTSSFLPILLIGTYAIMYLCFGGFTSVVGASPLDTIPSPISDSFIPVSQRGVEPIRNPGDFIGRVFAPKPEDWETRPEAQPITGVTVTIASGPRAGESVATNPSGYYRFQNVTEDELHLRVEKEHFEPKEVIVHRSGPTILANGDVPNYTRDPQQHPGNILIGHRWPDEVRFILEETLVVHDLLYVEGGRLPKGTDLGGFYSLGVVVIYSYQYADWKDEVGLLGTFAHEIAHAHQHATVSVDGSAWEIHGWTDTPEGRSYVEARRKDWAQVGKSPLDNIYGRSDGGGVALTETAAETCAHYWSVDRWGGRTAYGLLEVEAPNRYKWAEKWVPISIAVQPAPKVVSIPDPNSAIPDAKLAAAVREALHLGPNAPITKQKLRKLTKLTADSLGIKDLTGLEHATELKSLSLIDNYIRDVSSLAELTKLKTLSLADNRIIGTGSLFTLLKKNPSLKLDISIPMDEHPPMYWLTSPTFDGETNRIRSPIKLQRQRSASAPVETLWESSSPFQSDSSPQLAVDTAGGTLYWTERIGKSQSEIKSINLEGDPEVQKLLTLTHVLKGITVDSKGRKFYWADSLGRIQSANLNGKQIKTLIKDLDEPRSIIVDTEGGQLYWVEGTRIRRASLNGKNIQNVVTASSKTGAVYGVPSIAIVGRKIYWIQLENDATKYHVDNAIVQLLGVYLGGRILCANFNGSNIEELVVSEYMGNDFVVDSPGEALYYTLQSSLSPVPLHILRADLNGSESKVAVYYESIIGGPETLSLGTSSDLTGTAPVVHVESPNRPPMYWVDVEAGTLHRLIGNEVENLLPNVQNAISLAVNVDGGKLYWAEKTSDRTGRIRRANLDGSNVKLVKDLTSVPFDIALDRTTGKLYLINSWGKVQRLNVEGSNFQANLITDLQVPQHITLDAADGQIYWTEQTGDTAGKIRRANLNGSNVRLVKDLTSAPRGLALDTANKKLYLTNAYGKVQRLNVDGSNFQPNLITDLDAPEGVSVDVAGRKIYWTEQGNIRRADLNGENIEDVVTGLGAPAGIVLGTVPTVSPAAPGIVELPPDATVLLANYPNPFNPETWIPYQLSNPAEVTLHIHSVNGTLVRTLALGHQPAGMYHSRARAAYWDGKNEAGEAVASGIYFYTFSAGDFTATRKMLILK